MGDPASDLRDQMVATIEQRIHPRPQTLAAFRRVPREVFLPGVDLDRVYSGAAIPTRHDERGMPTSSSSEPAIMAMMVDALDLVGGEHVLEIGAGTGYNAAILAGLVGPENVVTVDIDDAICEEARARLAAAGVRGVRVEVADGWDGWPRGAPFERIELTASTDDISPAWVDQLVEGGILVMPVLFRPNAQGIVAFQKSGHSLESTRVLAGGFMTLRGAGTPSDSYREIGEWRIASAQPVDAERIGEILRRTPTFEVIDTVPWMAMTLFPIIEARSVAVARRDSRAVWTGLLEDDGIALVEMTSLIAPRLLLASFGAPLAAARLRERFSAIAAADWQRVRVRAVPSGGDVPAGDVVFRRPHYTFAVELAA